MKNKNIKIIDYLIVAISISFTIATVYNIYNTEPVALSPADGSISRNTFVLFEFENAEVIYIDDNKEFTSPERFEVENNFVINLKPGVYYWKIEGVSESEIREFTIESEVSLSVREGSDGRFEVVNVGSEELEVDVYEFGELKENVVLDVSDSREVSGDKFVGEKNG